VKAVLFLADGMADEPLEELGGKTPLEAVDTPNMDYIASNGACGSFLSLPEGFPTSSDVANMSTLGYDLAACYPGRGPLEAVSQGLNLESSDIAWRCNLVTVQDGILKDYSAGHIENEVSGALMRFLQEKLGDDKISFYPGVSYRNLLVLHGNEFSDKVDYSKPDSSQGRKVEDLALRPADSSQQAARTVSFMNEKILEAGKLLSAHPLNAGIKDPANCIWPWSPGHRPDFKSFSEKYSGAKGAVISAVDVIFGIAKCAGMDIIKVPGATGFVDTNYKGKADAAVEALKDHDFVYLHVEAIDECSHMGDLELKMKAISDFDSKVVGPVLEALRGSDTTFAVLPDHPVPIKLRKHTRTPVPVAICGPKIKPDMVSEYSEKSVKGGALGLMKNEELMRLILNLG